MKKSIIFLFLIVFTLSTYGQTESETIKAANELIANKKYESAFKLLDSIDPENDQPDFVLLKEDIVLNYFVTSIKHQAFALKDIEKNEDILDYRGNIGSSKLQFFPVDSIVDRLIESHPKNCKLYNGLGEYYFEVHLKYGGRWLKDDAELYKLMQINFQKAIDGHCADYLSYYVLGYLELMHNKNKESIPYFLKSIELKDNYASSHYNLAYAYLFSNNREDALKHAKRSLDLYTDQEYMSDACQDDCTDLYRTQ